MKYQIMMDIFFELLAKKIVQAKTLAMRNGVSIRSIYRYVDELTVAGVPIDIRQGRNGGIYISDAFKLPVNFMTEKEYLAAIDAMKAMRGQIEDKNLDSAIDKLLQQIKCEKAELSVIGDVIVDSGAWGDYRFNDKLHLLQNAIHNSESIEVDYISRAGEHTKRTVDPHVLVYKQNIWYIYAYCHKRKQFRLFKTGRIRTVRLTGKTFVKRKFSREDIPLQFRQENVNPTKVKLEISAEALPDAEEWLGVDCIQTSNGKFYAVIALPENDGLIRKILGLGAGVKVIYPENVRKAVVQAAKQIISSYE